MATGGFTPYKIELTNAEQPWQSPLTEEIQTLLDQPFFYLGKGVQFYAFISQDGKTVLKFMKQQKSRPSDWLASFLGKRTKQNKRRAKICESCKMAYEQLQDETGVIFVQIKAHSSQVYPLRIYDKLGIAHTLDLNKTSFVLQKYATPLLESLTPDNLKALFDFIDRRSAKGITNADPRIRNFGLLDDRIVEIDIGSFQTEPQIDEKAALTQWLHDFSNTRLLQKGEASVARRA